MKKLFYVLGIVSLSILIVSCKSDSDVISDIPLSSSTIEIPTYSEEDLLQQFDNIDSTITFTNDLITSDSISINISSNIVTITQAGEYVLTGSSTDAQIIINADDLDIIVLIFDNINITSLNGPVITVENADKVIINLKESTINQLSDSSISTIDHKAVIYSKDDLTINGSGSLTIDANYKNGIQVNDDLCILNTTISITSSNTSIKVNNSLSMTNANLTLIAGNDGIHVENEDDLSLGSIIIESGTYIIDSDGDAISSSLDLYILDGTFDLVSGSSTETSGKGLKASHHIIISSGDFTIDSIDDAINTISGILIEGGEFLLSSGDDAIHSDGELVINDGIIYIVKCFEGLESYIMTITGGYIDITSTDDGINGSGGVNLSEASQFSPDPIGTAYLSIEGGTIIINTMNDGIDTNGSVLMSGGLVIISGPLEGMQGAIDYDTEFNITGGTLVAAGAAGREQKNPSSTSTQNSVTVYLTALTTQMIHIESSTGETLLSYTPEKAYQTLVFSSPDLEDDNTFVVYTGGSVTGTEENTHGYMINGTYAYGTLFDSFNITSSLNTVGVPTVTDDRPPRP